MTGFIETLDEGEWKDGEGVPLKLGMSLRYYKRERDGQLLIEYDPINMVWRGPDGKNKLEEHKRNIGR
jgi:P2 family phage contractile tail tube protein